VTDWFDQIGHFGWVSPGTAVTIFEIFSPENSAEKTGIFDTK
jgi:hypothetical protein